MIKIYSLVIIVFSILCITSCKNNEKQLLFSRYNYENILIDKEYFKITKENDTICTFQSKDTTFAYLEKSIPDSGLYRNCYGENHYILCYPYYKATKYKNQCIDFYPIFNKYSIQLENIILADGNLKIYPYREDVKHGSEIVYVYILEDFGPIAYVLPYQHEYIVLDSLINYSNKDINRTNKAINILLSNTDFRIEPTMY